MVTRVRGWDRVRAAAAAKAPFVIRGAGTRDFYGQATVGDVLDMTGLPASSTTTTEISSSPRVQAHASPISMIAGGARADARGATRRVSARAPRLRSGGDRASGHVVPTRAPFATLSRRSHRDAARGDDLSFEVV
jgi:hypothetical protein